jgi:2-C-methyl-D-erythritol 4-phosphate cytidylyltransferase/2-C-methyl-D-erythritol 2,4-cyclodiphosphate synthase
MDSLHHSAALIVAAGRGERAGGETPKQFRSLAGRPVLAWSVAAFRQAGIERILVAHPPDARADAARAAGAPVDLIEGALTRTGTVRAGLDALAQGVHPTRVHIHDAARPGLTPAIIASLEEALADVHGAAPAVAPADSLKRVDASGYVQSAAPRESVMRVQTPQSFRFPALLDAYRALPAESAFDDDIAIATAASLSVRLIPGAARLMKLTYPDDFTTLEALMGAGGYFAAGTGFDVHRFGPGDHVMLCGVRVAHDFGLVGHSDADAPWHALTDAILGAMSLGDIGDHFPPSDPRWKGAPSDVFLSHAANLTRQAGARLDHVDITILCEAPRISTHRQAMRARTAAILELSLDRISVKATTTEKLGFLGRAEGLGAQASASVWRPA